METIYHYFIVEASRDAVYAAVSSVYGIKNWWADSVTGKYEQGKIIRIVFSDDMFIELEILVINQDEYLEWTCSDGPLDWKGTILSFTFEEIDLNNTVVKFKHSSWREMNDFFGECNFHWAHFLRSLKMFCETGKGLPFSTK